MRILVKEGEGVLADLSFEDEQVTIGSHAGCAIHLPDYRISERNAIITPTADNTWQIESLDYSHPITVNGHALTEPVTLQEGDEIVLYNYLLKVYLALDLEHRVREDVHLSTEELGRITQYPLPPGTVVKRSIDPVTLPMGDLDRISRMTLELATCRDIHELVDVSLRLLLAVFHARSAWIGLRRRKEGELEIQAGRLPSGQTCGMNPIIDLLQYRCVERSQHICIRKVRDQEDIGSAMAAPLGRSGGSLGMVYVDRRRVKGRRFQIPDLDLLSMISAQMAAKLEYLVEERAQRSAAVSSTEVSVVHSIQAHLDPKHVPSFQNMQFAGYTRSGQENPGDVYDVMRHPDTRITGFLLGHVNGSGALLALSMARLHSTFRVGFLHSDPPHALLRALNWLMYNEKDPSTVDAVCLLVDSKSGKMKYCRAGKVGGLIVDAKGEPRALLGAEVPAVGQIRNYEYISRMEQLAPGETLAIYSRGVATATNAAGERFGEKRFISLVCDGFCQPPSTTMQDITHELSTFYADGKHPDDITIALLHRLPA
jgi:serine phosphatase RsbU (regulator of sigma subunit)